MVNVGTFPTFTHYKRRGTLFTGFGHEADGRAERRALSSLCRLSMVWSHFARPGTRDPLGKKRPKGMDGAEDLGRMRKSGFFSGAGSKAVKSESRQGSSA